jgi:CheY-like chemotaxis protein
VITASSGDEGLALAGQHQPHLILVNWSMPGMDGIELVQRLKADARTRAIPVVACTAAAASPEALMRAGCVGYIPKPFGRNFRRHVAGFVRATTGRHRAPDPPQRADTGGDPAV